MNLFDHCWNDSSAVLTWIPESWCLGNWSFVANCFAVAFLSREMCLMGGPWQAASWVESRFWSSLLAWSLGFVAGLGRCCWCSPGLSSEDRLGLFNFNQSWPTAKPFCCCLNGSWSDHGEWSTYTACLSSGCQSGDLAKPADSDYPGEFTLGRLTRTEGSKMYLCFKVGSPGTECLSWVCVVELNLLDFHWHWLGGAATG